MRLHPLLLATGAMAAVVARDDTSPPEYDCVLANRREMAADAGCPDHEALASCFTQLTTSDPDALAHCYRKAGCDGEASMKADKAQGRCRQLFPGDAELRRRRNEVAEAPKTTAPAVLASADIFNANGLFPRTGQTGDDCLTTSTKKTRTCPVETKDGKQETASCFSTDVAVSDCAPGKTCSMDSNGNDICMDLKDSLDVAGIIISIVFGVLVVSGIGTLTFLCCKDRKEQKRLVAKAEATALARAATKKKKADQARDQRTPLMREERRRDASTGSADPFHDRNRS